MKNLYSFKKLLISGSGDIWDVWVTHILLLFKIDLLNWMLALNSQEYWTKNKLSCLVPAFLHFHLLEFSLVFLFKAFSGGGKGGLTTLIKRNPVSLNHWTVSCFSKSGHWFKFSWMLESPASQAIPLPSSLGFWSCSWTGYLSTVNLRNYWWSWGTAKIWEPWT